MANVKITELTAATALAGTDVLPIVDVGADATKKVSVSDLLRNLPDGTASAPALAFADDQNTGVLSPGNNSLAFATSGTQRLVIDSSGNCGINTTTPNHLLDVEKADAAIRVNALTGNSTAYLSCQDNTGIAGIYFGDAVSATTGRIQYRNNGDSLAFDVNGGERLRIDSSGNLGLGTTSPNSLASIKKDISSATSITAANSQVGIFSGSGAGTQHRSTLYFSPINSSGNGSPAAISTIASGNTNSSLAFYTNGANNYTGTPVERLRIDDSGNARFTQSIRTTASNGSTIIGEFGRSSLFITGGSQDDLGVRATGHMRFATGGNTERMRIDSSGRALIGKTSAGDFTTGVEFQPAGAVLAYRTSAVAGIFGRTDNGETVRFTNNGSTVGTISTTGSATAYNTSSDYRLKENVVDLDNAITRVKQLAPKRFNFIADDTTTVDGFLAHEAQTVVPEAVTGTHNEVDDDNSPVYQGIDQSKLVPLLTAALQEAIAKIETLEAKVAALEAQ